MNAELIINLIHYTLKFISYNNKTLEKIYVYKKLRIL